MIVFSYQFIFSYDSSKSNLDNGTGCQVQNYSNYTQILERKFRKKILERKFYSSLISYSM